MESIHKRVENLKNKLSIDKTRARVSQITEEMSQSGFWQNQEAAQKVSQEYANLSREIEDYEELASLISENKFDEAEGKLNKLELKAFLSGPYDRGGAVLTLHAGAGGVEAMDWTSMLTRMYQRYVESKGWQWEVLDETLGEEAGIKSITVEVGGPYAYGYLKNEAGVHRLVRQSPFNADHLRQTSFASVEVLPLTSESNDVELDPSDLKIETFRSSGPGGQHMQKTESAVRITHLPTGITAVSQADRLQQRNKEKALAVLKAKLRLAMAAEHKEALKDLKGEYKLPGWGNQIRSYVLHPYKLVKDLRTGYESVLPDNILNGELDEFIEAELRNEIRS